MYIIRVGDGGASLQNGFGRRFAADKPRPPVIEIHGEKPLGLFAERQRHKARNEIGRYPVFSIKAKEIN